ncbi:MAG: radical SAM protein, partial [bacterium]
MKFKINQFNYSDLPKLAETLKLEKIDRIEIGLIDNIEKIPKFSKIASFLYKVLDYESFFEVWLKNFPFCVISKEAIDHILPEDNFKGEKIKKCEKCLWNKRCSGFPIGYFNKYGYNEVYSVLDAPEEVMIEVTPKCNFGCGFCFNKISFAQKGRNIKEFSLSYLKKIVDSISESGVKIIRFTGGEPLLRKDIFDLLKYAKNKDLEVRLNTNGSLINSKTVKKLRGVVDNVLIPIESDDDEKESKLTNYD